MYKSLENQINYGFQGSAGLGAQTADMSWRSNRLNSEELIKGRESNIATMETVVGDYDILVTTLWESIKFMRSQGFYSENSFQLSAVQHLQSALGDILLKQKEKQENLEQYKAEHELASKTN